MEIYTDTKSHGAELQTVRWANAHGIVPSIKSKTAITPADIKRFVQLSDDGFETILTKKSAASLEDKSFQSLSFNDFCSFLASRTDLLKFPIVLDSAHLMVGYNKDDIRAFLPQSWRDFLRVASQQTLDSFGLRRRF